MPIFDDSATKNAEKKHRPDVDFSQAMQKAFWEELKGFILRRSTRLLPFDEVKDKLEIWFVRDLGIQTVSIDSIVGSEGRYRNFTKYFLPLKKDLRERWKKVVQAHYSRLNLPPVELYKVHDVYFVKDGHHRVSVARAKGVRNIEAQVYEYECDVPLDKGIDLEKLGIQETYHQFLKDTQLSRSRPHLKLQLTLLGGYPVLMDHIQAHKYYLEKDKGEEIPLSEAGPRSNFKYGVPSSRRRRSALRRFYLIRFLLFSQPMATSWTFLWSTSTALFNCCISSVVRLSAIGFNMSLISGYLSRISFLTTGTGL